LSGKGSDKKIEQRSKRIREIFSNYENAVTLISSLEAWFEHRWGHQGKVRPGLLEGFNRFPGEENLSPDFEVRFHTPYVIWGDHKRTIQPPGRGRDDAVQQILRYAARRPPAVTASQKPSPDPKACPVDQPIVPNYDVLVLVSTENDDVAAKAIHEARQAWTNRSSAEVAQPDPLAPIVVLGCHLDRESTESEWYKLKWRDHHQNGRFSSPNISADLAVEDLNALIVEASHHAIPVSRPALGWSGRNPFINDAPPAIYTAIRLVVPAICGLLSEDDRDQLQSFGRVDKTLTKDDLLSGELVESIRPQPRGLGRWVQAALDFLTTELNYARKVPGAEPQQYVVRIDSSFIKNELRELLSVRAASKEEQRVAKGGGRRRYKGDAPGQMTMFD
jgi:hypothetical protein